MLKEYKFLICIYAKNGVFIETGFSAKKAAFSCLEALGYSAKIEKITDSIYNTEFMLKAENKKGDFVILSYYKDSDLSKAAI